MTRLLTVSSGEVKDHIFLEWTTTTLHMLCYHTLEYKTDLKCQKAVFSAASILHRYALHHCALSTLTRADFAIWHFVRKLLRTVSTLVINLIYIPISHKWLISLVFYVLQLLMCIISKVSGIISWLHVYITGSLLCVCVCIHSSEWSSITCTMEGSSTRVMSYPLSDTTNSTALTSSKHPIHFLRSVLWPPTSYILQKHQETDERNIVQRKRETEAQNKDEHWHSSIHVHVCTQVDVFLFNFASCETQRLPKLTYYHIITSTCYQTAAFLHIQHKPNIII